MKSAGAASFITAFLMGFVVGYNMVFGLPVLIYWILLLSLFSLGFTARDIEK